MRVIKIITLLLITVTVHGQRTDLERMLFELPDVVFKPIESVKEGVECYEVRVRQPIDHSNLEAGYFYQRVFLTHHSVDQPMVMVTEGYDRSKNQLNEVTELLNANQLVVEHRFFGESKPEAIDYSYLNLEQVTADLHRINSLFKYIYKSAWVSTGISKGGQTTIYYRYFYPDDVDVSIPYVAPFNLELEDRRIYSFLDSIGTDACREDISNIQIRLFENREEVLTYLKWYSYGARLSYGYLGFEAAYEYAVLEYPFMFWQWGANCATIPNEESTIEELVIHLLNVSNIDFYDDETMEELAPHYYQAATEMGYYGYEIEPFEKYIKQLPTNKNPSAAFVPRNVKAKYNNSLALEVFSWLKEGGDYFIYIYGGTDTWTATAVPENAERDALWFILPNKDHGEARIRNMSDEQRQQLKETLERWLGINIR